MSARGTRLAAYLDQRRRMGEPGIVPDGLAPGELLGLLAARAEAERKAGAAKEAGSEISFAIRFSAPVFPSM